MKKISSESIRFLQKHISKKKLLPLMPLDENSVYDLMELIESEIEVPLAQSEDAGDGGCRSSGGDEPERGDSGMRGCGTGLIRYRFQPGNR